MIDRKTIHAAEQRAASHAAVFQIRCIELEQAAGPIARAIAAAALRTERAALDWAARRLETIRTYAAYEGIAGEDRPQAPQPFVPAALEEQAAPVEQAASVAPVEQASGPRSVECPKCGAGAGEHCHKDGRKQTRCHDARTRACSSVAPLEEQAPRVSRRLPSGADTSRSGRMMQARENAKHTPPALRTEAQNALIQIPNVYNRTIAADRALKAAQDTGHAAAIEYAITSREQAHAEHDRTFRLAYSAV